MRQLKADGSKGRAHGAAERAAPATAHSGPVLLSGVGISRMRDTAERQALPPAFMRGEGHAVAGGVSPPQRREPSQSRCACQLSQRESQGSCAPITAHTGPVLLSGVGIPRMKGTAYRSAVGTPAAQKPSPYKKPYTEVLLWKATKENSFPFWNLPES